MSDIIKEILISEKDFTKTNYEKLKKALLCIKKPLIDSDGNIYLTNDSLIEVINITTGSNNITLRKINIKPNRLDKMYMEQNLIEDKLHQIIDKFNERNITRT